MPETVSFDSESDSVLVTDTDADADALVLVSTCGDDMLMLRPALGNRSTLFSMSTYDSNRLASFKTCGCPSSSSLLILQLVVAFRSRANQCSTWVCFVLSNLERYSSMMALSTISDTSSKFFIFMRIKSTNMPVGLRRRGSSASSTRISFAICPYCM